MRGLATLVALLLPLAVQAQTGGTVTLCLPCQPTCSVPSNSITVSVGAPPRVAPARLRTCSA